MQGTCTTFGKIPVRGVFSTAPARTPLIRLRVWIRLLHLKSLTMSNHDNNFPPAEHRGTRTIYAPTLSRDEKVVQEPQKTSCGSEPAQARPDVDSAFRMKRRSIEPPSQSAQIPRTGSLSQVSHHDYTVSVVSPYVEFLDGTGLKTVSTSAPQFLSPVFERPSSLLCMRRLPS